MMNAKPRRRRGAEPESRCQRSADIPVRRSPPPSLRGCLAPAGRTGMSALLVAAHEPAKGRQVLDCASPLALWLWPSAWVESARGLAQSKTLSRPRRLMASKGVQILGVLAFHEPALDRKRSCSSPSCSNAASGSSRTKDKDDAPWRTSAPLRLCAAASLR